MLISKFYIFSFFQLLNNLLTTCSPIWSRKMSDNSSWPKKLPVCGSCNLLPNPLLHLIQLPYIITTKEKCEYQFVLRAEQGTLRGSSRYMLAWSKLSRQRKLTVSEGKRASWEEPNCSNRLTPATQCQPYLIRLTSWTSISSPIASWSVQVQTTLELWPALGMWTLFSVPEWNKVSSTALKLSNNGAAKTAHEREHHSIQMYRSKEKYSRVPGSLFLASPANPFLFRHWKPFLLWAQRPLRLLIIRLG